MKSLEIIRIELDTIADELYHEVQGESKLANQIQDLSDDLKEHIKTLNKILIL